MNRMPALHFIALTFFAGCAAETEFGADDEITSQDDEAVKGNKSKGNKKATDKKGADKPAAPADSSIVVYDLNAENVPSPDWSACRGSGSDFIRYLASSGDAPDIFAVQQMSGREQAASYAAALTAALGKPYDFVIAEDVPSAYASGCVGLKDQQTNALFYRTSRLQLVENSQVTFQPKRSLSEACDAGAPSTLSRTRAIGAKFRDLKGSNTIGVVSMHLPKDDVGCMTHNISSALSQLDAIGGNLRILAGDANHRERSGGGLDPWYKKTRDLGLADPIFDACGGKEACLDANWTSKTAGGNTPRIDFIFAKRGAGGAQKSAGAKTISFGEVRAAPGASPSLDYSDHRAIRSKFSL